MILRHSLAPRTRLNYLSGLSSYLRFCKERQLEPPLPAHEDWLVAWLTNLASAPPLSRLQPSTIRSYVTADRSQHIDLRLPTAVFESPHLHRFLQGMHNLLPTRPPMELRQPWQPGYRRPLLRGDLHKILESLLFESKTGKTPLHTRGVCAALALAWAAFLRVGELTYTKDDLKAGESHFPQFHLTRNSITFDKHKKGYRILLPSSKTSYKAPVPIWIAATNSRLCPFQLMDECYRLDTRPLSDPLFFAPGFKPITREYIVQLLRRFHPQFNGHSFRRGAATWAVRSGTPLDKIQHLGR